MLLIEGSVTKRTRDHFNPLVSSCSDEIEAMLSLIRIADECANGLVNARRARSKKDDILRETEM